MGDGIARWWRGLQKAASRTWQEEQARHHKRRTGSGDSSTSMPTLTLFGCGDTEIPKRGRPGPAALWSVARPLGAAEARRGAGCGSGVGGGGAFCGIAVSFGGRRGARGCVEEDDPFLLRGLDLPLRPASAATTVATFTPKQPSCSSLAPAPKARVPEKYWLVDHASSVMGELIPIEIFLDEEPCPTTTKLCEEAGATEAVR